MICVHSVVKIGGQDTGARFPSMQEARPEPAVADHPCFIDNDSRWDQYWRAVVVFCDDWACPFARAGGVVVLPAGN